MSAAQFSQALQRLLYRNIEDDDDIASAHKLIMQAYRIGVDSTMTHEQLTHVIMAAAQRALPEQDDRLNIRKIMLTAFQKGRSTRQGEHMRSELKKYSGQIITVTANYMYEDARGDRGHLVREVQDSAGETAADHLWIKADITADRGDLLVITGEIHKYGSFSRDHFAQENYGIQHVTVDVMPQKDVS